ncbi:hypothetical protein LTS18_001385, partial [Coniosporium uncinatum]
LGWIAEDDTPKENELAENKNAKRIGMVASRDFNHVQVVGERILKSSKGNHILGELYFYCHMPDVIADLFPTVHSVSFLPETTTYSFTMQKLGGTTYAHFLSGRLLTHGRLRALLSAVRRIHDSPPSSTCTVEMHPTLRQIFDDRALTDSREANIYENYTNKLEKRYNQYRSDYDALGETSTSRLYSDLVARLRSYEQGDRGCFAHVIHGDPVFSNALLNETKRKVFLYDMRSQLGSTLTTAGDVTYDLAKLLQSLNGYDHVILADDEAVSAASQMDDPLKALVPREDRMILQQLQEEVYWPFVTDEYPEVRRQDIVDIMASLLFSLIPLHTELRRGVFLKMCENVVEKGSACPL